MFNMKAFRQVNLSDFRMVKNKHNDWQYNCYFSCVTALVDTHKTPRFKS